MATTTELTLIKIASYWRKRYDDCNPDVGMGPFDSTIVSWILDEAGLTLTDEEKQEVEGYLREQNRRL